MNYWEYWMRIFITKNFKLESPKIFLRKFRYHDSKLKQKLQAILKTDFWERAAVRPPSNGKELRDIQHSMSIVLVTKFIFDSLWHYCKIRQLVVYKMRQTIVTKCVRFFITNYHSFVTKCNSYYKMQQFCYKMRQ